MNRLSIQDVSAFPKPGTRIPTAWQFAEDGRTLYYLYAAQGTERALWAYDTESHERRIVAEEPQGQQFDTFDEEMRRQRMRRRWDGIASYQAAKNLILVPHRGRLYLSRDEGPLTALSDLEDVVDPSFSHDAQSVFGVVGGNVVQISVADGQVRKLTHGAEDGLTYGLAEYIAQEELERLRGYWLSSDDAWLLVEEVDERHIPTYSIVHQQARGVWLEPHRYPFVGQDNARVRLGLVSLKDEPAEGIRWVEWDAQDRYLMDVLWGPNDEFLVLSTSRTQQHLSWDRYGVDGRWMGRVYEESSPWWINRPSKSFVTEDNLLVTTTEREDLRKLLVVSADGDQRLVPEQDADFAVQEVLAIDPERHTAFVEATRHRALERTLLAMDWQSGEWKELTSDSGFHQFVMSPLGRAWLDIRSDVDHAPEVRYVERDGAPELVMESTTSREALDVARPEFFSVAVADGTELNGLVYLPEGDAPAGGWPLIVSVYGGPHAQMVVNEWIETVDFTAQYLVQHGFMVMKLDNRGSANRGHAFERPLFRHFGDVEVADQVAGVHWVAQSWPVNLRRVGIYGWSYGGYMTLRSLLMAPQVFSVGVSGAPVTDFRWYDTAYTERYLGTDEDNHEGYETTSLIDKAARLQGKLLLVHGMVDENVHFRHSAAMIDALVQAGKDFDLVVLPDSRHMISNPQTQIYRDRRLVEYFEHNL